MVIHFTTWLLTILTLLGSHFLFTPPLFVFLFHSTLLPRQLIQEDPIDIYATGSAFDQQLIDAGVMDTAQITLKFPSGILCTVLLTRGATYGFVLVYLCLQNYSINPPPSYGVLSDMIKD